MPPTPVAVEAAPPPDTPPPRLIEVFLAFSKIGLTSFGGGLSGWMMREFVHRRAWLGEAEFLSGLALAQAFPGVNVVNLSIWIGFRMRGMGGAVAGALGMVLPPMTVAILLAAVFSTVSHSHLLHVALSGVAAAAVGLALQTGMLAARRAAVHAMPVVLMVAVFVAIFQLRLPLIYVMAVMAPLSIALAYLRERRRARLAAGEAREP